MQCLGLRAEDFVFRPQGKGSWNSPGTDETAVNAWNIWHALDSRVRSRSLT